MPNSRIEGKNGIAVSDARGAITIDGKCPSALCGGIPNTINRWEMFLMKTWVLSVTLGAALFSLSGMSIASDDFSGNCKRKEQAIETKMEYARKHGNQEQIRGLEEALSQVRRWCSDESLHSKAAMNVLEKQDKVKERQAELAKAVAEGKEEKKIAKLQRKLDEAKEELAQAVATRDALGQ